MISYSRSYKDFWNEIKELGLYRDLNELQEEVCKNLSLIQAINSSKSWKEDVVMEILSIQEFSQNINSDLDYILSKFRKF